MILRHDAGDGSLWGYNVCLLTMRCWGRPDPSVKDGYGILDALRTVEAGGRVTGVPTGVESLDNLTSAVGSPAT